MSSEHIINDTNYQSPPPALDIAVNDKSIAKENEVYFIVLRPSEEKIDFTKVKFKSDIIPKIIHNKNNKSNLKGSESYLEEIVFKFIKKNKGKKATSSNNTVLKYIEGDDEYVISFSAKNSSFVYETELKKGNKYLDNIVKENIDQSIVPFYNKLDIFIEALKENKESNNIEKLYEDTITLYEKKKKFSLLISLFLKLYGQNKVLCKKLLDIFNKIREEENTDRDKALESNLNTFIEIYENANDIIQKNEYDAIKFYGVLFCYFNYYYKNNFSKMIKKFSEGNADILYEILIIYYSHFINPLNQNKEFYNNFIKYLIKKDKELNIFKKILNYIDDIETFLYIINENKDNIFKKYDGLKLPY